MKSAMPKPANRKWRKRLLWLLLAIVALLSIWLYFYGPWIAYHVGTGPLGGSAIVETDASCGDGEYRVVVYKYRSGDGYLELRNRAGKVFDSANYANGIDYGPLRWNPDCMKVMITANEGMRYLEVSPTK